ncbi:type II toxin-antitoxin system HipA family toxin [Pseudomonas sp. S37]|nr:type II toxin-antitoxin system HipA family toxin [Pseudomonas sp. S37]
MSPAGRWQLAPAYDVTFCEGPGGYHQMDVMGEALAISRAQVLRLAEEAEVPLDAACKLIDRICNVAGEFASIAGQLCQGLSPPIPYRQFKGGLIRTLPCCASDSPRQSQDRTPWTRLNVAYLQEPVFAQCIRG